ncbi:FMN reductase [Streptomyces sp. BV286]|uniref:FMN reductase n=1 Tax=Streptomyces sp. BV286 TaxID=2849672 RepID=UPI001C2DFF2F|nr:FMN reductase [Streptomyces sp. BV286]MBV1938436.1 FMN reductase [Streptomyces sp. BV286]
MKLVVVSAGLSVPSSTRLLGDRLAAAVVGRVPAAAPAEALAEGPVAVEVVELRDLAVEIAHNLTTGFPGPALRAALDAVASADGLVVVTPVFSASYSGLFKSFFDVLDRDALGGKPVLIAATGGSARHSLVLEHALRPLFAYLRAVVVPTGVYAASEDWGAEGLAERIERAAGELAGLMSGLAGRRTVSTVPSATPVPPTLSVPSVASVASEVASSGGGRESAAGLVPAAAPSAGVGRVRAGAFEVVPFEQQLAALRPE